MTDRGRTTTQRQLDDLDDRFTAAGLSVAEAMPRLVRGFLGGEGWVVDEGVDLARSSAVECRSIEHDGFVLLARFAPVGGDLRRLVALLRMCVDVDRSAALLRHACASQRVIDPPRLDDRIRAQLKDMAERSSEIFRGGVDAWRSKDALAVNELDEADEAVDHLQRQLVEDGTTDRAGGEDRIMLGLLARYFERIADHGVAIARDTAFAVTGERIGLPSKHGSG